MPIEILETERLRIRQFHESDLDRCRQFRREVFALDESPNRARSWLLWTIDSYRELSYLGQPPYADYAVEIKDSGELVGAVGIVPALVPWGALKGNPADQLLSPEIGLFWGIMPDFRRRGFASEAAGALLAYLFHDLAARQVVATTERDNIASRRTMQRLGMRLLRNPNPEPHWCQVVGLIEHSGER
ncbi:MAG: GNAT family N-acetyltransferase [Chloroflexi bacterium]|nr:GNAT family N-acetyltransferase [Chloroflexota bacterium]